jgi:hypothetical protein
MGVYSPIIANNTTSFLQVGSTNVTYEEIKESLGSAQYLVQMIYIASTNQNQILQTYTYQITDANGNERRQSLIFPIDPYQQQSAIFQSEEGKKIIFNGQSSLSFAIYPQANFKITLFYTRIYNSSLLNKLHESNFQETEKLIDQYDFFDGLEDIIPDI